MKKLLSVRFPDGSVICREIMTDTAKKVALLKGIAKFLGKDMRGLLI